MKKSTINFRTEPIVHPSISKFFTFTEPNFYHSRYKPPFDSGSLNDSQKPSMKSNLTIIHFEEGSPHNKSPALSNCKIEPRQHFVRTELLQWKLKQLLIKKPLVSTITMNIPLENGSKESGVFPLPTSLRKSVLPKLLRFQNSNICKDVPRNPK